VSVRGRCVAYGPRATLGQPRERGVRSSCPRLGAERGRHEIMLGVTNVVHIMGVFLQGPDDVELTPLSEGVSHG